MRLIKIVLAGLLVLVTLVVGAFVSSAMGRARDQQHEREVVRGRLQDLAQERRPVAVGRLHAGRPRFAALGRPVRSWSGLSCRLDSRDAGIMVQGYEQACRMQAVEVYATGLTLPEVLAATGLPAEQVADDGCWTAGRPVSYLPAAGAAAGGTCPPPEPGAPAALPGWTGWMLVQAEPDAPATAGTAASALLVVVVDDYEGEQRFDLGCDPWSLLFCDAPPDGLVLPT